MAIANRALVDQQYAALFDVLRADEDFAFWPGALAQQLEELTFTKPHGKRQLWLDTLAALPPLTASDTDFSQGRVRVGRADDAGDAERAVLEQCLETFIPWRKGPFDLFSIHIDTEWRSDWKWQRVLPHLSDLQGRRILDVGCGSGYHLWRMYGAGAAQVVGIDPSLFFLMQFLSVKHYVPDVPVHFLPLRSEDLPDFRGRGFDTVFSMGVLYHRRSPLDHLQELKNSLRAGGELVLETLVVDGDVHTALMPEDRYGKMRNVWFIPSVLMLELWLRRLGFRDIRTVDVTETSTDEQRSTDWMRFESLADFLDPDDSARTIEGYPAPKRAVIIANLPV
ncbi:MAG: tRNA 5-methoxyuridine(34)/uridine 5-oxyacetic acid(34) synthase CmoB [Thiolinea sp.]